MVQNGARIAENDKANNRNSRTSSLFQKYHTKKSLSLANFFLIQLQVKS